MARLLAARGAIVVDTDAIARSLTEPGGSAHAALVDRFGPLDRAALAEVAFTDPDARRDLNALVHPLVEEVVRARLAELAGSGAVVVVEVPLLVEAGWQPMFDAVVVVDAPEEIALERAVAERGMDREDVRRRMATQVRREERLANADHILSNDSSLAELEAQVDALLSELVTLRHRWGG